MSIVGLLQAAAVLTIILSLLTAIDISHRNIELLSHFRLQYFVVSLLLTVLFAYTKTPLIASALLLTTILNGVFIVPWYLPGNSEHGGTTRLKLLHANVQSSNDEYQRLFDLVAAEDPDMIFLQEVTMSWASSTKSQLQDYPHAYTQARDGNFGIAAFSKIPFDSIRHVDSPPFGYPTIIATTTFEGQKITFISSHPTIPVGREFNAARNLQLESLTDLVKDADSHVVLLGDLNASVWDTHYRRLVMSTGLSNARQGFGILPTWPTLMPFAMIPIDHVLISDGIGVFNMKTAGGIGSDHLPLIVTLSL